MMSDTILKNCHSVAICNKAKNVMDYWWEGLPFDIVSCHHETEGITFSTLLIYNILSVFI